METHRKAHFVALVERATQARLEGMQRRHACCVAPGLGAPALARLWRAERLPADAELDALAERLSDWALGLVPPEPRPYAPEDLER